MDNKAKISDETLIPLIKNLKNSWIGIGYKRIASQLSDKLGCPINKKRIYRLMKEHRLLQTQYKRIVIKTPPLMLRTLYISKWVKWELMRKLRALKRDKGWSWEVIAKEIGASKRSLLRWNKQRKTRPTFNRYFVVKILTLIDNNGYYPKISQVMYYDNCNEFWFDNMHRDTEIEKSYSKYYRKPSRTK